MTSTLPTSRIVALTVASCAVALSSCSLPPKQAWRKIRTEGVMAYVSYEMNSQHRYAHLKKRGIPPQPIRPALTPIRSGETLLARPSPDMRAPVMPLANAPGSMTADAKVLTAIPVPALPGFVRSPYTNPPRLVDVKGGDAGTTMVCPYTARPFIIPADVGTAIPGTMMAKTADKPAPSTPTTTPASSTRPSPPPTVARTEPPARPGAAPSASAARSPAVASTPAPAPAAPSTPVSPPAKPKSTVAATPPAPAPAPATLTPSVPEGSVIPGRPGFVNSPYAAKHQLVDVTGLAPGMEVKCPYTGKLFRVPSQEMATSKPKETPPVASPERKK